MLKIFVPLLTMITMLSVSSDLEAGRRRWRRVCACPPACCQPACCPPLALNGVTSPGLSGRSEERPLGLQAVTICPLWEISTLENSTDKLYYAERWLDHPNCTMSEPDWLAGTFNAPLYCTDGCVFANGISPDEIPSIPADKPLLGRWGDYAGQESVKKVKFMTSEGERHVLLRKRLVFPQQIPDASGRQVPRQDPRGQVLIRFGFEIDPDTASVPAESSVRKSPRQFVVTYDSTTYIVLLRKR